MTSFFRGMFSEIFLEAIDIRKGIIMLDKIRKQNKSLALIIVMLLTMGINFSLIFNDSVWFDESFTMLTIKSGFKEIIQITIEDVHPPLYYLILKCAIIVLGYSVSAAKIVSLIPVLLAMVLGVTAIRRRFPEVGNKKLFAAILFVCFLSIMPSSLEENLEVRMYTWAMFFVTASGVYAFEAYLEPERKKNWIVLTLSSLAAAYTHYFALISVAVVYVILFLALMIKRKKIVSYLISGIVCGIGYLPWLPFLWKQINFVKEGFWIPEVTLEKVLEYVVWIFQGEYQYFWFLILILAFLLLVDSLFHSVEVKQEVKEVAFSMLGYFIVFIGTILAGGILSVLIRPILVERYLFVSIGLLYIFLVYSLTYLIDNRKVKIGILALIILTGMFSYGEKFNNEYKNGTEDSKKIFADNISDTDLIATNDFLLGAHNGSPLLYYLPENNLVTIETEEQVQLMEGYNKIWYFATNTFNQEMFTNQGYSLTYIYQGTIDVKHPYTLYLIQKNN